MSKQATIRQFVRNNPSIIIELGKNLFENINPSLEKEIQEMTLDDCTDYIHTLTFDGYIREKSVINDGLVKIFPEIRFEESPPELDHSGDVDYLGFVDNAESQPKAFGIQIKPVTAKSNFGNYSISERMKASFDDFTVDFGGKVFIVFSLDGEIGNKGIIKEISTEIERLRLIN